jgi:hypothetical protein
MTAPVGAEAVLEHIPRAADVPASERDEVLAGAGGGKPARPPRLLQPRNQRRVHRRADRPRPVFVEVNHRMPRTQGLNQLHASQRGDPAEALRYE